MHDFMYDYKILSSYHAIIPDLHKRQFEHLSLIYEHVFDSLSFPHHMDLINELLIVKLRPS